MSALKLPFGVRRFPPLWTECLAGGTKAARSAALQKVFGPRCRLRIGSFRERVSPSENAVAACAGPSAGGERDIYGYGGHLSKGSVLPGTGTLEGTARRLAQIRPQVRLADRSVGGVSEPLPFSRPCSGCFGGRLGVPAKFPGGLPPEGTWVNRLDDGEAARSGTISGNETHS